VSLGNEAIAVVASDYRSFAWIEDRTGRESRAWMPNFLFTVFAFSSFKVSCCAFYHMLRF
jgi:hypothetical protein